METNRGRQAIDKPLARELARPRRLSPERSSTRSTTASATPSSIPQLGAKPGASEIRPWHRRRDRTDPSRRTARTRDCQPPSGCCPGWRRPDQSRLWSDAWPQGHCRWSDVSARRAIHGGSDCHPAPFPFSGLLRRSLPMADPEGRPRCSDAKTSHDPQCHSPGITRRGAFL